MGVWATMGDTAGATLGGRGRLHLGAGGGGGEEEGAEGEGGTADVGSPNCCTGHCYILFSVPTNPRKMGSISDEG